MKVPLIRGVIDRRILVNFRVDPEALRRVLPEPFRPKLHAGTGIGGVCLIRLTDIRPRGVPRALGIRSENAAHRIAVEWDAGGERREGVFIPRRDTSSALNALVGGRLFPGVHHRAAFDVDERDDHYRVRLTSDDGETRLDVAARLADRLPATSSFRSLGEASAFFERGSLGYSPNRDPGCFDALELHTDQWHVDALDVSLVTSSFFEDERRFPPGTVEFDCALLMRGIDHEWRSVPALEPGAGDR